MKSAKILILMNLKILMTVWFKVEMKEENINLINSKLKSTSLKHLEEFELVQNIITLFKQIF